MLIRHVQSSLVLLLILVVSGCGSPQTADAPPRDTCYSGTLDIAVDASLQPVMEAEVQAFESTYTQARFNVRYVPEAQAVALFLADSVELIAIPRALRPDEVATVTAQNVTPRSTPVGRDGLAVIVNPVVAEGEIDLAQLRRIVTGEVSTWGGLYPKRKGAAARDSLTLVVDDPGSSLVSYLQDSLIGAGGRFTRRLYSLGSNEAVIDYVSRTRNAIGLIGLAWISDRNDSTANTFLSKIKVLKVARAAGQEAYDPIQFHLHKRNYPLIRKLHVVQRTGRSDGLGACLSSYIAGDKGQLIIHQLDLMPYYGQIRLVELKKGDYR